MLIAVCVTGIGLLWLALAFGSDKAADKPKPGSAHARVTNVEIMAPGQAVNPEDVWVGQAGRKLEAYEAERAAQERLNADRKTFEERTNQLLAKLAEQVGAQNQPQATLPASPPNSTPPRGAGDGLADASSHAMPPGLPPSPQATVVPPVAVPTLSRIEVSPQTAGTTTPATDPAPGGAANDPKAGTLDSYLPVSFVRAILIGGIDAPTGGQAQSNPHPVLLRLVDNAVLPNGFRSDVKECFAIAAGYGDISAERAYIRGETLSCVRSSGASIEVAANFSIFGEDGKYGVRGRLVTKQGQMLANALMAGIVGGLGQGLAQDNISTVTTPAGSLSTVDSGKALQAGMSSGVGKAMDRLAQYYIKLAEQTFPVIEIDAGRQVDIVMTRGVRISGGRGARSEPMDTAAMPAARNGDDDD